MPPAAAEPEFTPPVPVHRALSNGLRVTVVEKKGVPIVAFALVVQAGAITDPVGLPGLASFTTQLLPEGTTTRSSQDIANEFEFIGARLSTETRKEVSLLSTETLSKHWDTALELMADVARNPTFPEHEVERVRREHLTDIRRGKDDPTFVAESIIPGLVFGPDSRYGHPSIGTESSVAAFTKSDLEPTSAPTLARQRQTWLWSATLAWTKWWSRRKRPSVHGRTRRRIPRHQLPAW